MAFVVQIIGAAAGSPKTEHDGRWLISADPHTPYGELAMTTTDDRAKATRFDDIAGLFRLWRTVSKVQLVRPTDGRPNRPLTGMSFIIESEGRAQP